MLGAKDGRLTAAIVKGDDAVRATVWSRQD